MISKWDYFRFVPRIFLKRGLPLQLIFFVTSSCNLRCRHCFYWKEVQKPSQSELTFEEIEKIAKRSKLDLLWLSLTGGEPFLRPDLGEIAKAFCQNGRVINISIPTNGQLTKATFDSTKKILKFCPNTYILVSVSLEGPEGIHDQIRNCKGAFGKAIGTFQELKKLKTFPNFGLSIQTTFTSLNQDKLKEFYIFSRDKLEPDYINLNLIRGNPADQNLKKVDIRYYEELVVLLKEDVKKGKWPYFNFPFSKLVLLKNFKVYEEIIKITKSNKYLSPCYSLNLSGVINEKGDVYPCELLNASKVGNLREKGYDLTKLWFSPKADQIRKRIKKKCFCTYECALSVNKLFSPRFYAENLFRFFTP